MKTIAMGLVAALISTNAMASTKCFLQVAGEAKALEATKTGSVVLTTTIGNIQATALVSLDADNEVTDLQIKDVNQNFAVSGVGAYDLSKRPASLAIKVGEQNVSLVCAQ